MRDDTVVIRFPMSDTDSDHTRTPPHPSSTPRFLAIPLVLCLISIVAWSVLLIGHVTKKPPARTVPKSLPVVTSTEMVQKPAYEEAVLFDKPHSTKNFTLLTADESLDGLPAKLLEELQSINAAELIGLRCSDRIVAETDGFFIREANTHAVSQKITREPYGAILRAAAGTVSGSHILLTARFCETETGDLLFEYSTGILSSHHPDDGEEVTTYLAYIERGKPFRNGASMLQYDVWPYPGCRRPLVLTGEGIVYYECGIVTSAEVNATYHRVDFSKGTSAQVGKCIFTYTGGPKKTCRE